MFLRILKTLGLICLGLLIPVAVYAQTFYDVPSHHNNHQAISYLSDAGVIRGYPDGSFQAQRPITRAEAVKLLIAAEFDRSLINHSLDWHFEAHHWYASFPDVRVDEWFAPYTEMAYQNGIVHGYPDGEFKPHNTLNFAEGLKIILEASNIDTRRIRFNETPLLLVNRTDWFARYFGYAHNKNLINRDKFYHPAQPMTRGEFAEVLYRLKTIQKNGLNEYQEPRQAFSDEYTITVPRLNIINVSVTFADPYSNERALGVLKDGLGHYLAPPGSGEKMVLFGHSSGYSWDNSAYKYILRKMNQLKIGDMIYINYHEKGYAYKIHNKEVIPARQLDVVMKDYGYEELALYTCWPPDGISHRYVVYAAPYM